jgi:hypothetical protein
VKRYLVVCAALWPLLAAHPAAAQVFGQLTGAVPVGVNNRLFGAYLSATRDTREAFAQLRTSFYPGLDFGFHGGLARVDVGDGNRTAVELGGDLRTRVAARTERFPVDIALGGAIGLRSADSFNMLSIGPTVVASRAHAMSGGNELTPYGGLALLYSRVDVAGATTTDVSIPLRLGLEFRASADLRLVAELQATASAPVDQGFKLVVGANFPF